MSFLEDLMSNPEEFKGKMSQGNDALGAYRSEFLQSGDANGVNKVTFRDFMNKDFGAENVNSSEMAQKLGVSVEVFDKVLMGEAFMLATHKKAFMEQLR